MMNQPMGVALIMRHGRAVHGRSIVAEFDGERVIDATYARIAARAERLAGALAGLGVCRGDRVATFCWNHAAHMEAYLAIPSMGAVLHTLNIRLFPEQIAYIVNHADDRVLLVDAVLLPLLDTVLPLCPGVEHIVVVGARRTINPGASSSPGAPAAHHSIHAYDTLLDDAPAEFAWPDVDEDAAAAVCYTSGTTGNPKGVVYSHKSTFVHSLAARAVDTFAINQADRILLVPPMFHANAWGLPYAAWMSGADLVMPGPHLQAPAIARLLCEQRITFTAAVPTIISDLLRRHEREPVDASSLRMIVSGGSAVPRSMVEAVRRVWGVPLVQGWGMTETSPLCAVSVPPRDADPDDDGEWRARSGRPVPGVEIRLVDESGAPVVWDGTSVGELQLRGPWVTGAYHDDPSPESFTADGWLRTGDVGTIDDRAFVQLTDRTKDVIKSGGEWISSVELENRLVAHPAVVEAAVIAVADERWQERPLAVIVREPAHLVDGDELRTFLADQVARWWLPERFTFVDALPKTSVGKIDKRALRAMEQAGSLVIETTRTDPGSGPGDAPIALTH